MHILRKGLDTLYGHETGHVWPAAHTPMTRVGAGSLACLFLPAVSTQTGHKCTPRNATTEHRCRPLSVLPSIPHI